MKSFVLGALAWGGLCVWGLSCGSSAVRAEGCPAGFAVEIAEVTEAMRALGRVLAVAQDDGYGLLRSNEFAVYGKFIPAKRQEEVVCWLDKGLPIRVLAPGNSAATDVDLRVLSPEGFMIASDTRSAADASVSFTTEAAGLYRLNLELCQARQDSAFCALAVLQKQGYAVARQDLDALIDRYALGNGLLAGHTNGQPRSLTCRQAISTWPLLGCVLDSNARAKHWATADRGSFLVTVFADPRAQDVDALVCDPADRRIEHKGPEPYGVVEFDVDQPGDWAFIVSVPKTSKPTLSLLTIVRAE